MTRSRFPLGLAVLVTAGGVLALLRLSELDGGGAGLGFVHAGLVVPVVVQMAVGGRAS